MSSTTFGNNSGAISAGTAAIGVNPAGIPYEPYDLGWNEPCGGMWSSVADLAKFGSAILQSTLLPPYMTQQWLNIGYLNNDGKSAIGMPWESAINSTNGFTVHTKGGNVPGYAATLAVVPELDLV